MRVIVLFLVLLSFPLQARSLEVNSLLNVKVQKIISPVKFDRMGFNLHRSIYGQDGRRQATLSCLSLNDNQRERFAAKTGSDPVSDLSCYLKDLRNKHEYTILSLPNESLQFSPAFFWVADVAQCNGTPYIVEAHVRGISIRFVISNFNVAASSAVLSVYIAPDSKARSMYLDNGDYRKLCYNK